MNMLAKLKLSLKISKKSVFFTLLILCFPVVVYYGWPLFQDYTILNQVKSDEEKIKSYSQKAKLTPNDAQSLLDLGDAYMAFWESSGKGIRVAKNLDQSLAWNWLMNRSDVVEDAVLAYEKSLKINPRLVGSQVGLCYAFVEIGNTKKALSFCRQAVDKQPQNSRNYQNLGFALVQENQPQEAEKILNKSLKLDQENAIIYYLLGDALLLQEKTQEAVVAYRKSIELDPKGNLTYLHLGYALRIQNQIDEAIAVYRKSIELVPNYPPAYQKLGDLLAEENRLDEAISTYHQAMEIDRSGRYGMESYIGLGQVLVKQKKLDEAIKIYRQAIELEPKNSNVYYLLGLALIEQKKIKDAVLAFQESLKLDPQNTDAREQLNKIKKL
ncbi:MAG: tetratricopeptide repeat protein [Nostocales cyanobacterium]|nr:MAG: tetratricopeptide repeat protein [Nostocales cyanobacterium]TAF14353.1 MAG: tetratricopeptide repeat protein [Nostocales cyanobacterium]